MKLRQVTDGSHIVQMIYGSDGDLKNCEHVRQKAAVRGFLTSFKEAMGNRANVTLISKGDPLPADTASWLDFETLKALCKRNKRMLKKISRRKFSSDHHRADKHDHRTTSSSLASSRKITNATTTTVNATQRRRHRADSFLER